MDRATARFVRKRRNLDRITLILIGAFVILAMITAVVAFFWARSFFASWRMTNLDGNPPVAGQTSGDTTNGQITLPQTGADVPFQAPETGPAAQPWDGKTRVTILVMGLDYRDCEANQNFSECDNSTASRTDSMMLLTIDPVTKSAGLLSIPRDLWVYVPGYDYYKINTAYFLGEANKLPEGGPGLAMDTVEQVLGVPIQYYALVDFNAFVRIIDELGGVKIRPTERIKIDPIGPNNTFYLDPGAYVVDGATALAYARNRYTEGGDFDRANRQQEVLLSVRDRVLRFNMLPTLVTKAPALYNEVQKGVRTNLTLQQIVQLALLAQQIGTDNIKRGVIGPPNYITFSTSPDGQAIEIPVTDQIRLLRDEIFASGTAVGPAAVTEDVAELMKQEKARVVVKNGTSTEGLASRTADFLRGKGVDVVDQANADQVYSSSTIIDYTGKPYTIRYLAEMLKVENTRVLNRFDPNAQVDVEVIIGTTFDTSQLP
jgi:LCP family protein required for cell wall assembly